MKVLFLKVLFFVWRILFGGAFIASSMNHFMYHVQMAPGVAAKGLPLPELAVIATGLLIFLGGTSVVLGAWPRVGLSFIMLFLALVTPIMHSFWADTNPQHRIANIHSFISNVVMFVLALLMLLIPWPWPFSVDGVRQTRRKALEHAASS